MVKLNKKISLLLGILFVIASVAIISVFFNLTSPRTRVEADIKDNILQSDILSGENLLYAKDSSAGLHYSQLDSSFRINEQQSVHLLKRGPFKSCGNTCKSTAWDKLDRESKNITYPIAEISNLADQSEVYCASQTSGSDNVAHTTRDICLDTKTGKVWYTVYLP